MLDLNRISYFSAKTCCCASKFNTKIRCFEKKKVVLLCLELEPPHERKSVLFYLFISKAIKQIVVSNFIQTFFLNFKNMCRNNYWDHYCEILRNVSTIVRYFAFVNYLRKCEFNVAGSQIFIDNKKPMICLDETFYKSVKPKSR
jgi:hypothetical protein